MKKLICALVFACVAQQATAADTSGAAMRGFLDAVISTWMDDPVLTGAILDQNQVTAGYSQATIDEMDNLWRAYQGVATADIIVDVIRNPAADFLRQQIEDTNGIITEAFIMDARGLNVAAAAPTSDLWQGDEAKFTETYPLGPGATHFGEIELDDSTQEVQSQISVTIVDAATGDAIGALTVGVNLSALM